MNGALRRLLWLETRGQLRQAGRRLRTPRGIAVLAAFVSLFVVIAVALTSSSGADDLGLQVDLTRRWGPLLLLGLMALGFFSPKGLYFKPAEVAHLFPAPLPRHQLVLFNVMSRARIGMMSAFWLAALPSARGSSFAASLVGYSLIMIFLQVSAQWFAVGRQWLGAHRKLRLLLVLCTVSSAGWIASTRDPSILAPLLWLTRPFIETLIAPTFAGSLVWAGGAVVVVAAAIASLCILDVGYVEAALAGSRKAARQRSRTRSGGVFSAWRPSTRLSVPRFPHLAGVGPIAWRQSMEAVRNPRGVVMVFFMVMMGASVAFLSPARTGVDESDLPVLLLPTISLFTIFTSSLLVGDNLALDFRRDLDRMPMLKSLPLSSLAISAGQVAAATFFVTVIQLAGAAIVIGITGVIRFEGALLLVLLLPLANWTAIAIENALFLSFPYRTVAEDPADVAFIGRMMLGMLLKLATIATVGGTAVGFGWLAWTLLGGPLEVAAIAAGIWLAAACIPLTLLVAWAFDRFDVVTDTPT